MIFKDSLRDETKGAQIIGVSPSDLLKKKCVDP